ncbi:ROK family protein [Streptomyces umbrinus]|uniref:ROK family protein n=1 Tax=Streptomyces umbrinus TaxID=67370 RepID=UPI003C2C50FE
MVSAADPVDRESGRLVHLPDAPFLVGDLDPPAILAAAMTGPVLVDNDVNWAARAEHRSGCAAGVDDFVYLHLSEGLGCAVVNDGIVLRGHKAWSVRSPMSVRPGDGSAMAFTEVFAALGVRQPSSTAIDVSALQKLLSRRDEEAERILTALAGAICGVPYAAVSFADPQLVVIGGEWRQQPDMIAAIGEQFGRAPRSAPPITTATVPRTRRGEPAGGGGTAPTHRPVGSPLGRPVTAPRRAAPLLTPTHPGRRTPPAAHATRAIARVDRRRQCSAGGTQRESSHFRNGGLLFETMAASTDEPKLVGSDRVLAVLAELARHPEGIGLEEMARAVASPKPTVHRALASLRRAGFAAQGGHGRYLLGDEFLRMAFAHHEARPDHVRVTPVLKALCERYGETVHYAVLDGTSVVYRSKLDPDAGAVRLTSVVGGRNPAHCTGVGKVLLAYTLPDEEAVRTWVGDRTLERPTEHSIGTVAELHAELARIREQGYATDDQENEPGVNCVSVPAYLNSPTAPSGAISISGLTYRTPLAKLVADLPAIRSIVSGNAAV